MKEVQKVSITNGSFIRALFILLGVTLLFLLKDIVVVLLTSIVIASFVEVVADRLKKKYKIPRPIVVSTVFFGLIILVGTLLYFMIPMFLDQVSSLAGQISRALPNVEWLKPFQSQSFVRGAANIADGISSNATISEVVSGSRSFITQLSTTLFSSLSTFFGGLVKFVLVLVISFYLSMQERGIENFLRLIVPLKREEYVIGLWKRVEHKIALWVKGQLMLGLIIGVLVFIGLQIIGIQYSLLLALIAAVFELVPFGIIFAIIPAVAVAGINNGISTALVVLLMFIVVQQLENYIISPILMRRVVGVPPLVVILSVLIGFNLIGIWGVFLAVPSAVLAIELLDDVEKKKLFQRENA